MQPFAFSLFVDEHEANALPDVGILVEGLGKFELHDHTVCVIEL